MTEDEKRASHERQLERMRAWRRRNPGYSTRYYRKNAEQITKYGRRQYMRNREKVAKQNRERYHENKQKIIDQMNVLKAVETIKGLKSELPQELATKEVMDALDQLCVIARYAPRWKDISKRRPAEDGKYLVTYYGGVVVAQMATPAPGDEPNWYAPCIGFVKPEKWCHIPVMPKE